jgi:ethanolaminephosphotransferase
LTKPPRRSTDFVPLATLTFYVQTWDEYYTQTLTLGIVSGPVEGILTLCIVYAITAVKGGGSYWHQSMIQTLGIAKNDLIPEYVYNLAFYEWYMVYGGIVLVANTLQRYLFFLPWDFRAVG